MSPCEREAPDVLGPLLTDKSDADEECFSDSTHRHVPDDRAKTRFWLIRFLYVVAFLFYTLSLCFLVQRATIRVPELLPLPAREALRLEARLFATRLVDNPFTGPPRAELDRAWHELLQNDNIRVTHQELDALNLTSVYLKDGSGGIASLSVFHALHCLKKVRQMVHKSHYHDGKDERQMAREEMHVDHCIEYLRESLLCKPDLSLVTYHWINQTSQHPDQPSLRLPTSGDGCLHECVDWQALNAWAGRRVFDLFEYDLLRRPEGRLRYEDS